MIFRFRLAPINLKFPTTARCPFYLQLSRSSINSFVYLVCLCYRRALHMKEHPDYKYRPRRKPKTLVKPQMPQNHQKHHSCNMQSTKESQQPPSSQPQHLSSPKYPFSSSLELTLGIQPRATTFPLASHYQVSASPLDTTLALDLQARLQQMYAGSLYPPWRYFGCPSASAIVQNESQNSSSPLAYVCVKPPKRTPSPVSQSQHSSTSLPSVI